MLMRTLSQFLFIALTMASTPSVVRHRGGAPSKKSATKDSLVKAPQIDALAISPKANAPEKISQWDYKLALAVITIFAFATRFYGISHPNEVVFDEVHFGKVRHYPSCNTMPEHGPWVHSNLMDAEADGEL